MLLQAARDVAGLLQRGAQPVQSLLARRPRRLRRLQPPPQLLLQVARLRPAQHTQAIKNLDTILKYLLSYRRASYSTAINRHPAATEPFNLRASGSMQKLIVWHASACLALCLVAPAANARSQRKLKTTVRTTCRHFWASRHAAGADISSGRGTVA